jgi:hypothetical protein
VKSLQTQENSLKFHSKGKFFHSVFSVKKRTLKLQKGNDILVIRYNPRDFPVPLLIYCVYLDTKLSIAITNLIEPNVTLEGRNKIDVFLERPSRNFLLKMKITIESCSSLPNKLAYHGTESWNIPFLLPYC